MPLTAPATKAVGFLS